MNIPSRSWPAIVATVWLLATTVVWIFFGWQLPAVRPVWQFLPDEGIPPVGRQLIGIALYGACFLFGHYAMTRARETRPFALLVRNPGTTAEAITLAAAGVLGFAALLWWFLGRLHIWNYGPMFVFAAGVYTGHLLLLRRADHVPINGVKSLERWLLIPVFFLILFSAAAPAVESDGLRYHLTAPQEWRREGALVTLPYSANSNLPSLLSLATAVLSRSTDLGLVYQTLNVGACLLLALLVGALARRLYTDLASEAEHPDLVFWSAALLVATIPVVSILAAWPFADVAAATFLVAAVLKLLPEGGATLRSRDWAAAGVLLGASCATKLSMLPLAAVVGVWGTISAGRRAGPAFGLMAIGGLLMLLPWLGRNWAAHGNPVYPLGYGLFGGPEWSTENDAFYKAKAAEKGIGRGVLDFLLVPWRATAHFHLFEGHNPGPALLGLLPLVFIGGVLALRRHTIAQLRGAWGITLLLIAVGLPVWFISYQSIRFLVPHFAFLAAGTAALTIGLAAAAVSPRLVYTARIALLVVCIGGFAWTTYYRIAIVPTTQAGFARIGAHPFIQSRFNAYTAIEWLNDQTTANEPVFYIGEHRGYFARQFRPILSDWFDTPRILVEIRATEDNEALLDNWRGQGIRFVLLNQAELSQYEVLYFRPRFTDEQWERFVSLREVLLQRVVHHDVPGVMVARIDEGVP